MFELSGVRVIGIILIYIYIYIISRTSNSGHFYRQGQVAAIRRWPHLRMVPSGDDFERHWREKIVVIIIRAREIDSNLRKSIKNEEVVPLSTTLPR